MPVITRWYIKTSLIYLLLAFLVGLLQAFLPVIDSTAARPFLVRLEPVRVHLFVVGWITLLIFGVVLWMFPKYSQAKPRGYEQFGWAAYGLVNIGLVLRVIGEGFTQTGTATAWLLVVSAAFQWLAGLAFFWNTWKRVKEK